MQAVIFDIDHTIFDAEKSLHDGVNDLLNILRRLGVKVGAISNNDHRALVRLDEAGVRAYFADVVCSDHTDRPKAPEALHNLLKKMGVEPHQAVLVSHAHADILLGKDAQLAKTIGVSHGLENVAPLREAGADHVVVDIPGVLDVLA